MRERVRVAVDIAFAAFKDLEPEELDDGIEELERRMIALAEQRQVGKTEDESR